MAVQGFFSRLSSNRAHWSLAPKVCPEWLGNLSLLIEIILQVQSTGLASIFLRAQPFICNTISKEPHMMNMEEEWSSASSKGHKKSPQLILLVHNAFDISVYKSFKNLNINRVNEVNLSLLHLKFPWWIFLQWKVYFMNVVNNIKHEYYFWITIHLQSSNWRMFLIRKSTFWFWFSGFCSFL